MDLRKRLFQKKEKGTPTRCTFCKKDDLFFDEEIKASKDRNAFHPVCDIIELCPFCWSGYQIPIDYTDKNGKRYQFKKIKPKINNPDPKLAHIRKAEIEHYQKYGTLEGFP